MECHLVHTPLPDAALPSGFLGRLVEAETVTSIAGQSLVTM